MKISNSDLDKVKKKYPGLKVYEYETHCIISGKIALNHIYNDVRMIGTFKLEIMLWEDFPKTLPIVKETSNKIDEE